MGTSGGLVRIDKSSGDPTFYNRSNSGLPYNFVFSIAIDESGNKWFGTYGGCLARFDESNWSFYNTSNSGLSNDKVWAQTLDNNNNKWI